jgi:hypothetical protein
MRFPGGRMSAFSLSYDDGVGTDLRLMDIMRKHGLKGTFNISSRFLSVPACDLDIEKNPTGRFSLRQIVKNYGDFEVATHGATHPFYAELPTSAAVYDIVKDREVLERAFGRIIRGHAYPNGSYTAETVAAFRAAGILYARTTARTGGFDLPEEPLLYGATAHHKDGNMDGIIDRFFAESRYAIKPRLFCVWGHSYEFETDNNWHVIEHIAERVGGHDEVWYAGLQEIFEYVAAYRSLVHSMDSNLVHNPTAKTVWISSDVHNKSVIAIAPGETVRLDTNG